MKLIDKDMLSFTDFEIVMCDGDFSKAFKLICEKLDNAPIIETKPIKHGKWVPFSTINNMFYCSACGQWGEKYWNYCPNCGARMEDSIQ